MYFDNDDIEASKDCLECQHNNNCDHYEGLYLLEGDNNCWYVCNECGFVVYYGTKKAVESFLYQKQNQLEFDFS